MTRVLLTTAVLLLLLSAAGPAVADLAVVQSWPVDTFPGGICYDADLDHIFLVNNSTGEVWEFTRTGGYVNMWPAAQVGLVWPIGMDIHPETHHLWVCDESTPEQVVECTRDGVAVSSFSVDALMEDCSALAYNPNDGLLYIADDNVSEVVIWTTGGDYLDRWSCLPNGDADALCYVPCTNTLYVGDDNGAMIYEFTLDGTFIQSWDLNALLGLQGCESLTVDPVAMTVFIGDSTTSSRLIYEVSGFFEPSPVEASTWGSLKALYQ